jgi:hypothetical protein
MRYLMTLVVCAAVLPAGMAQAHDERDILKTPNTGMVGAQRLGSTEIQNGAYATYGVGQYPWPVSKQDVKPIVVEPPAPPAPATIPAREEEAPLPDEVNPERFQREPEPREPEIKEMP